MFYFAFNHDVKFAPSVILVVIFFDIALDVISWQQTPYIVHVFDYMQNNNFRITNLRQVTWFKALSCHKIGLANELKRYDV
jgi:hypothetical protein